MEKYRLVITPSDRLGYVYSTDENEDAIVVTPNLVESYKVESLTPFMSGETVRLHDLKLGDVITKFSGNKLGGSIKIAKVVSINEDTLTLRYDFDNSEECIKKCSLPVDTKGDIVVAYLK